MKNLIFSVLPLALVSANPIEPRQENSPLAPLLAAVKGSGAPISANSLVAVLPKAKLAKVEELPPLLRPTAKRMVATYGPYTLVGKNEPRPQSMSKSLDPKGQAFMEVILEGLCQQCTVLTGKPSVRLENGKDAEPSDGIYLHHFLTRDYDKPAHLPINRCATGAKASPVDFGSEFLAKGDDSLGSSVRFTSSDGTANTGYYIGKNDRIMQQVDIVHYNDQNRTIYFAYDIEYIPGKEGMRDAATTLLSVTGCPAERKEYGGKAGIVIKLDPNGASTTDSAKYPILNDTTLVASRAHMHDGGKAMVMLINDKEVCESKAVYGKGGANNDETIVSMSECPPAIKMKKGDILTMKSIYDLKTHPLRSGGEHSTHGGMPDVMGMFFTTFSNDV
ncbi:hypothetical protein BLS_001411 [Venturia inaequalis]|uniref:Uncharacterized protein n=1 Tax=Venturia inaequalis TaxID=5025 RepID=A0A8H3VSV2_VENIN|nr:hypothetical protein BLS_001411 [Venturia inaequalis]KAE9993441.1 hypothetical protein EG327_004925 [Venturia inaequalis]RDI89048.1 hypothetical protein Vi05172_g1344 [Venturia inaequalis]